MDNAENAPLDSAAVRQLFLAARSQNKWLDKPVSDEQLRGLYELVKWGPTSMNCSPMRLVFVRSPEARERLLSTVSPGNHDKVHTAPVVAIVGYDTRFFDKLAQYSRTARMPARSFTTARTSLRRHLFAMARCKAAT